MHDWPTVLLIRGKLKYQQATAVYMNKDLSKEDRLTRESLNW